MATNRYQIRNLILFATIMVACFFCAYLAIRVTIKITHGTLDAAPKIGELTATPQAIRCVIRETYAPHEATVQILGIVESKDQFLQIFPLLRAERGIPGADVLNGKMSDLLHEEPNARTAFAPSDFYWPMPFKGIQSGRSFGGTACYSERTGYFFLEYRWSY